MSGWVIRAEAGKPKDVLSALDEAKVATLEAGELDPDVQEQMDVAFAAAKELAALLPGKGALEVQAAGSSAHDQSIQLTLIVSREVAESADSDETVQG